jgi:hypothetical protein
MSKNFLLFSFVDKEALSAQGNSSREGHLYPPVEAKVVEARKGEK